MERVIRIKALTGRDACGFVAVLANAYGLLADRVSWATAVVLERAGQGGFAEIHIEVKGGAQIARLDAESGRHRVQTTEHGTNQTSELLVEVVDDHRVSHLAAARRSDGDFEITWFSGTGKGGQNRNKRQNCCRVRHLPTGMVRAAQTRSRRNSMADAMAQLTRDLDARLNNEFRVIDIKRLRRTYDFRSNRVIDHETGRETSCDMLMKGYIDVLWQITA